MDRLIKDAARLDKSFKANTKTVTKNGKAVQELDYNYADVVKAIHVVQTNMGITGTTAREAAQTISGSVNMLKSAWKNLLTGIGSGNQSEITRLVGDVVKSAETAMRNVIPVAKTALTGIGQVVRDLAPVIGRELPGLAVDLLPAAGEALSGFMEGLFAGVPGLMSKGLPMVIRGVSDTVNGIVKELPKLGARVYTYIKNDLLPDIAWAIAEATGGGWEEANSIYHGMTDFLGWFEKRLPAVADGIKQAWVETIKPTAQELLRILTEEIIPALGDFYDNTLKPLIDAIGGFGELFKWIFRLWAASKLAAFFGAITTFAGSVIAAISSFVTGLQAMMAIFAPAATAAEAAAVTAQTAAGAAATAATEAAAAATAAETAFAAATKASIAASALLGGGAAVGGGLLGAGAGSALLGAGAGAAAGGGGQLLLGAGGAAAGGKAASGILGTIVTLAGKAAGLLPGVAIGMQAVEEKVNAVGVAADEAEYRVSQYTSILQNAGKDAADDWASFALGIDTSSDTIDTAVERVRAGVDTARKDVEEQLTAPAKSAKSWGSDLVNNFRSGIEKARGGLINAVSNLAGRVRAFLGFSEPEEGPLSDFHTYAPDMMRLFAKGIEDNAGIVTGAIDRNFDFGTRMVPAVETGARSFGGSAQGQNERPTYVVIEIDGLQSTIYKLNKAEEQRVGVRLAP